jgi:hypothetical protein
MWTGGEKQWMAIEKENRMPIGRRYRRIYRHEQRGMVRRYCMYVRPAWYEHVSASAAVVACPVRNIDRRVTFRCMHHPQSIMDPSNGTWFFFFKGWIISLCIVLCCLCQVEWFPTARRSMSRKEIANEATEDATARPTGNTTMYVCMYVGVDVYK